MKRPAQTLAVVASILPLLVMLGGTCPRAAALDFPGPAPGKAVAAIRDGSLRLENNVLRLDWQVTGGTLRPVRLSDKLSGKTVALGKAECFQLLLGNTPLPGTRTLPASELRVVSSPVVEAIRPEGASLRAADRQPGQVVVVKLASADGALEVTWQAVLRDGSNYVGQLVSCQARQKVMELVEVVVWDLVLPGAEVRGVVDGSPVVAGNLFFAAEHPASKSRLVDEGREGRPSRFTCSYQVNGALQPGQPQQFRALVGVTPEGQLRRGFLYYLERERAQPYRQFLHYNNGYEIGCKYWSVRRSEEFERFRAHMESQWVELIHTFGRELTQKRDVRLESFVHDHGWDDETLVWQFHAGYPNGFAPAQQAAAQYGSAVGIWFSPFGGYAGRKPRVENGMNQGLEVSRLGLTLAGPRYYDRFSAACRGVQANYGVNYFKFDGFGAGNNQPGAGAYASDVEGLLRVIAELRHVRPDVFVNPSTGSWPSPFWLRHCDCIWRQGSDTNISGKGSDRQQWITYRDGQIRKGTLDRGPLYPMSSLMIHGIFINDMRFKANLKRIVYDPGEITAEIRSFFATGVNLQEMYINPQFMTDRTWDVLAEGAKWARAHADVLADTHWIGGQPADGEVYGWASWAPHKAVLALRNPGDRPARFALDVGQAFELPAGAAKKYVLTSPWKDDAGKPAISATAGQSHVLELQPFEVVVLDARPAG